MPASLAQFQVRPQQDPNKLASSTKQRLASSTASYPVHWEVVSHPRRQQWLAFEKIKGVKIVAWNTKVQVLEASKHIPAKS